MTKKKRKVRKIWVNIGKGIYGVFDKILITPISRVVYKVSKFGRKHSGIIDSMLNKPNVLLVFSLLIAVGAFFFVNIHSVNLIEKESEIISGQTVEAIYNEEKYVVEGIPEAVDIILMGRKSDLYLAKQLGDHKIVLDLSDYKTGEYRVKLKYNHSVASISYKLDPSSVVVKISEKESATRTLTYDLLNQDKLDSKLNVSEVKLDQSEVYIKGSHETLEKVATVKALIDASTLDIKESGSYKIDSLPMVAYDETGKALDNVEIVPKGASATIKVESFYADVPVKVVPVGEMATGYSILSTKSSVGTVRIYGDQNVINSIQNIKAEIDVDSLSTNKEYKVTLTKPSGVRFMSETTTTVNVTVGGESTREVTLSSIEQINLGSGYNAQLVNAADSNCVVIIKGVNSIIENMDITSISAYVDLSGRTPGTYDVPVVVKGQDLRATYTPKVQTIQVRITAK